MGAMLFDRSAEDPQSIAPKVRSYKAGSCGRI